MSPEIEQAILDYSLQRPSHGPLRVSQELPLRGITVSSGGVRGVWSRHELLSKHDRLLRLEREQKDRALELSDEQTRLLGEYFSVAVRTTWYEQRHQGRMINGRTPSQAFVEAIVEQPEAATEDQPRNGAGVR